LISAVRTDADMGRSGTSGGVMVRLMLRRGRPARGFGFSGFSGFSCTDERCFLGDIIGSVLTGSAVVSYVSKSTFDKDLLLARTGRSGEDGLETSLESSVSEAGAFRRLNLNGSEFDCILSSSSCTLNFRFDPVLVVFGGSSSAFSGGDSNIDTRRMFSFGPLSLRFLRVSRLADSAGSPSWMPSSCSSSACSALNVIGPSLSNLDTGGGPMSGDWLSAPSSISSISSALHTVSHCCPPSYPRK
jgi:hypothetical protein